MTPISTVNRSRNGQAAANEPCLRVILLGGLHEIGKNTCVFEYGDDLMLVDAGLAFPSDGMHGVNVVLPDTSFLRENQKRIRGMIVTHGHEDHIGVCPPPQALQHPGDLRASPGSFDAHRQDG